MKGSYTDNRPDPVYYGSPELPVIPLDLPAAIVLIQGLREQIAALEKELSDKSWRLRNPYDAFLFDATKKDNCRNCGNMRPATLSSATDRISCKYAEGWPHWSTRCNKWEKEKALRGGEE